MCRVFFSEERLGALFDIFKIKRLERPRIRLCTGCKDVSMIRFENPRLYTFWCHVHRTKHFWLSLRFHKWIIRSWKLDSWLKLTETDFIFSKNMLVTRSLNKTLILIFYAPNFYKTCFLDPSHWLAAQKISRSFTVH